MLADGVPAGLRSVRHDNSRGFVPENHRTCSRFYDTEGEPVPYPGEERLIGVSTDQLRRIPAGIGITAGANKVLSGHAAAKAGLFRILVTDEPTGRHSGGRPGRGEADSGPDRPQGAYPAEGLSPDSLGDVVRLGDGVTSQDAAPARGTLPLRFLACPGKSGLASADEELGDLSDQPISADQLYHSGRDRH
ncbi:sugar-binding domain-containing protein [Streptomyces aureus]|uniref:sugar-binding domain-containing protein n=1 Tax=Streptomyces aureus TaxID=193461 RepID=UPI0033F2BF7F